MKFLVVFALALATVSGFNLRSSNIESRSVVVPVAAPEGRITNGQDATLGQFPYQVGLFLKLEGNEDSWCGGSVISNEWILTAAHCTKDVLSIIVYLGATVRTEAEIQYVVNPSDIIIHADYDSDTLVNDISLIKIPSTAYTSKIQPVELPAIASSYPTYTGEKTITSGWGLTSDTATVFATDLQWARLQVISNSVCARSFGNMVTPTNICVATPGGVSTCRGDSGGALVLESTKVQIGLTSYGAVNGCTKGHPAVFTRVTSYLDWIQTHTGISL